MFGLIKTLFGTSKPADKTQEEILAMDPVAKYLYMTIEAPEGKYNQAELDAAENAAFAFTTKPHITAAEVAAKLREAAPLTQEQVIEALVAADPILHNNQPAMYYRVLLEGYPLAEAVHKALAAMDDETLVQTGNAAYDQLQTINAHAAWRRKFQEGVDAAAEVCRTERAIEAKARATKRDAELQAAAAYDTGRAQGQIEGAVVTGVAAYLWSKR
jgi:hypothetical protein